MTAPTLRADAARNLELILEAAESEFAEKGHEACVADIAARAGVGQATIFRRFETKDDLVVAVFERKFERLHAAVDSAMRKRTAWDGLLEFMATCTQMHVKDRGFFQAMAARVQDDPRFQELKKSGLARLADLVAQAQADGTLRPDIRAEDIPAFCVAAAQAATMGPAPQPRAWKRYLEIITAGMHA